MNLKAAASLLALMIVLPGCFAEDPEPAGAAATTAATQADPTGTPSNETNATNAPPVANLTADPANGSAPLTVNFTITLSDADGDALTWTLDADGNATTDASGDAGNLTANFTYATTGLYNATLMVSDGTDNATVVLGINVTAGSSGPIVLGTYAGSGTISAYALTNSPETAAQCPGFLAGQDGVGCVFLEFPVGAHDGRPAIITTNAAAVRAAFWDKCTPTGAGKGFHGGAPGSQFKIPAGAGCAVVWSNNSGDAGQTRTFTLTVYDALPEPE